jgi:hypothetical protein
MQQTATPLALRTRAVLATMHGKERVIAPILSQELGIQVAVAEGVDTDTFGTFTRDIGRTGNQRETALRKARAGLAADPLAGIGIASEGSFFAHPHVPFVPVAREIVLFLDRHGGLELVGQDESVETNYGHVLATRLDDALAFASTSGFPGHGLVVMGASDGQPDPDVMLRKDLEDVAGLASSVERAIRLCGCAWVETDMRAHRNPTRMAAIARATRDLVQRFRSRCPRCDRPGFDTVEHIQGLPCRSCGNATRQISAGRMCCDGCGHTLVKLLAKVPFAEPASCDVCNP